MTKHEVRGAVFKSALSRHIVIHYFEINMEPDNSEYCERIAFLKQDSTAPDMYKLTYDSDEDIASDKKRTSIKKKR